MQHAKTFTIRFLVAYSICIAAQAIGGYYTNFSVQNWYPGLNRSPLTPPGMWFGIVWTLLYLLMAFAAARIAHILGQWNNRPLRWWMIQLFTGVIWCMVFFGHRDIVHGLWVIAFEWVAILITVILFGRINRRAAYLMLPLLAWVTFASYLNLYIVQHN